MTNFAGSTITTTTTSTGSTEATACSATAVTTTVSTVAPYSDYCTAGNCVECNLRRDIFSAGQGEYYVNGSSTEKSSLLRNSTLVGRDIPEADEFDPYPNDQVYVEVVKQETPASPEATAITRVVKHNIERINGLNQQGRSSSRFERFENKNINFIVAGLTGCTVVAVVSQEGAWVSHLWEGPGFQQTFQQDILDYFQTGRQDDIGTVPLASAIPGVFTLNQNAKIYIMTPAILARDLHVETPMNEAFDSMSQGEPVAEYGPGGQGLVDRLTPLEAALNTLMPNVPIETFIYRKRARTFLEAQKMGKLTAPGAMVVVYSNQQVYDWQEPLPPPPATPEFPKELAPPQKARWACYMQWRLMGSETWDATPAQVAAPDSPDAPAPTATNPPTPTTDLPFTFSPLPTTTEQTTPPPESSPSSTEDSTPTTTEQTTPPPESSSSPTEPPPIPWPTATDTVHVEPYCYLSGNRDGHVGYGRQIAASAVDEFCNGPNPPVLEADSVDGLHTIYSDGDRTSIHLRAAWAEDQTGCADKARFDFNNPEDNKCRVTFDADYFCNVGGDTGEEGESFGGGFVLKTPSGLCMLIEQYATWDLSGGTRMSGSMSASDGTARGSVLDNITITGNDTRFGVWDHAEAARYPHLFNLTQQ